MRAMQLAAPAPIATRPLSLVERDAPRLAEGEVRVRVEVCGVCRTDLHVVEGDLAPHREFLVPGHQVVGRVVEVRGDGPLATGDRVGVAWLNRACGVCRFCVRGAENLCTSPRFTGWDCDGGYAEEVAVPAEFAYCALRAQSGVSSSSPPVRRNVHVWSPPLVTSTKPEGTSFRKR